MCDRRATLLYVQDMRRPQCNLHIHLELLQYVLVALCFYIAITLYFIHALWRRFVTQLLGRICTPHIAPQSPRRRVSAQQTDCHDGSKDEGGEETPNDTSQAPERPTEAAPAEGEQAGAPACDGDDAPHAIDDGKPTEDASEDCDTREVGWPRCTETEERAGTLEELVADGVSRGLSDCCAADS